MLDEEKRELYKLDDNRYPEGIRVRTDGGELVDISQRSELIGSLRDYEYQYKLARAYHEEDDEQAKKDITDIIEQEVRKVTPP